MHDPTPLAYPRGQARNRASAIWRKGHQAASAFLGLRLNPPAPPSPRNIRLP
jgi:hypothetical protein